MCKGVGRYSKEWEDPQMILQPNSTNVKYKANQSEFGERQRFQRIFRKKKVFVGKNNVILGYELRVVERTVLPWTVGRTGGVPRIGD